MKSREEKDKIGFDIISLLYDFYKDVPDEDLAEIAFICENELKERYFYKNPDAIEENCGRSIRVFW